MRIRLKQTMCGPGGNFSTGSVIDLPGEEAADLVARGQAEAVEPVPAKAAETAAKPASAAPLAEPEAAEGTEAAEEPGTGAAAEEPNAETADTAEESEAREEPETAEGEGASAETVARPRPRRRG